MALPDSEGARLSYDKSEKIPVKIRSDIHPWMSAYHLPLDHPFGTATDTSGRFMIRGLPPGEHTLKVWHETMGWLPDAKISVPKSRVSNGKLYKITMSAEMVMTAWKKSLKTSQEKFGAGHPHVVRKQRDIDEWTRHLKRAKEISVPR